MAERTMSWEETGAQACAPGLFDAFGAGQAVSALESPPMRSLGSKELEFLPMRFGILDGSATDNLLSAEKTMRNIAGASPSNGVGSSPFLSDSMTCQSAEKTGDSLVRDSPKDSPCSGGGFKRNSFVFAGIKQELGSVEGSEFGKRPSSPAVPETKRHPYANLSINTKLTVSIDENGFEPSKNPLRRGSIVCSPHEGDLACFTPTFPNVAGFEEEVRPMSWSSAVGALGPARPVSRSGSFTSGAGSPTLSMRDPDSRGGSPALRPARSPTLGALSPCRPMPEQRTSCEGGVRVFSPVTSSHNEDSSDFIITTPAFMGTASAAGVLDNGDTDMDMCCTPVASAGGSLEDSFKPARCVGDVDRAPRRIKGFGRRGSLYNKKDYTFELLGRSRSDLTYDEHYQACDLLGKGDFGEVWTAMHHRTGDYFALKKSTQPFRGTGDQKKFLREVRAMRTIASWVAQYEPNGGHPNIVRYERAWQDNGYFYIVMELCKEGTLRDLFDYNAQHGLAMVVDQIWLISKGLMTGLHCIHSANYLHLDLKPDNLFLSSADGIKIGDFGLVVEEGAWDGEEGDRRYLAPEVLQDKATTKADIFSAGLIVYQMLMGIHELPGNGEEWQSLRRAEPDNMQVVPACPEHESLAKVVTWMIHPNPAKRPSAAELIYGVSDQ